MSSPQQPWPATDAMHDESNNETRDRVGAMSTATPQTKHARLWRTPVGKAAGSPLKKKILSEKSTRLAQELLGIAPSTPTGTRTTTMPSTTSRLGASSTLPLSTQRRINALRASNYQLAGNDVASFPSQTRLSTRRDEVADDGPGSSLEILEENRAMVDASEYEAQRTLINELKAELAGMKFRIQTYDQDKAVIALKHENEQRVLQRRIDDAIKQLQVAEGEKAEAERQRQTVANELAENKETSAAQILELQQQVRQVQNDASLLKERLEDLTTAKNDNDRMTGKKCTDLQAHISHLTRTIDQLQLNSQERDAQLLDVQKKLAIKEKDAGALEAELLRLRAVEIKAAAAEAIQGSLKEQIQHIKSLEESNSAYRAEMSKMVETSKRIDIVEEERRNLQRKLEAAELIERELTEARMRNRILEGERQAWTRFLQTEADHGNMVEFQTPVDVARALVKARHDLALLTEQLGGVEPQIAERDHIVFQLEKQEKELKAEVKKLKTNSSLLLADKARDRTERQLELALREAGYLRAQLKASDAEKEAYEPEKVDQDKAARIAELDKLVDSYKTEVQTLHRALAEIEAQPSARSQALSSSAKHPYPEDESADMESPTKRRRTCNELRELKASYKTLEQEHSVTLAQLAEAKQHGTMRVLSLKSNPTDDHMRDYLDHLKLAERERNELRAVLQAANSDVPVPVPVVPASCLEACKAEIDRASKETASAVKRADRLMKVWTSKSREFKEAVFSTLGWNVTFIPNGQLRVESIFRPSETEALENSIIFDGERGTMKVSGGPDSKLAEDIGEALRFWVREQGCIPAFLAQLTVDFVEAKLAQDRAALEENESGEQARQMAQEASAEIWADKEDDDVSMTSEETRVSEQHHGRRADRRVGDQART